MVRMHRTETETVSSSLRMTTGLSHFWHHKDIHGSHRRNGLIDGF